MKNRTWEYSRLSAHFYKNADITYEALFHIIEGLPWIVPVSPEILLKEVHSYKTFKGYKAVFYYRYEDDTIGKTDYDRFLDRVPDSKKLQYDADHYMIMSLTLDEIRDILGND